jgi:hypothetical protein
MQGDPETGDPIINDSFFFLLVLLFFIPFKRF